MACEDYYATPEEYIDFWCVEIHGTDEADQVKNYLRRAASTINMSRQAQGACDCTLSNSAVGYLRDLSIVIAVVYHNCPCAKPNLSDAQLAAYIEQTSAELLAIREGTIELCDGETGSDFPAIGWAEQSLTDFATAEIIYNAEQR
jgi:hypothetical protein